MDFTYLTAQTFGDIRLERELLALFLEQGRRLIPALPELAPGAQEASAHLLKGSARAIGATALATAVESYESAAPSLRRVGDQSFVAVTAAFAAVEAAIVDRLSSEGYPCQSDGRPV